MHAQPKIFQAELAKILASDGERIEVVLFQVSPQLAALFLVFAPEKSCYQKEQRHNDRGDHIDAQIALHHFAHRRNILSAVLATDLRADVSRNAVLGKTAHRAVATILCWRKANGSQIS